ncbi:trehalose synthase [Pseudonocardia broussonetiae]|uniref:Trehalose synthase n=1 Tax=Pseudonocardia broussonetiae TaxID=2736640 RepID=A0A6M6JW94_9PSEU|nr:trehalose synthase [Pseudonocardia broussonetiae]
MNLSRAADLWWKNAVVYCLDVETFADGNGDGCGDLRGLIQHIDHLDRLGVTCLWLMPFYPSPDRDDGYDITDFYGVDPRLGTSGDLVELVRTARDRGMRVIADLVVNHTSAQHPWFLDARSSRDSRYRDWYVWRDEPPADAAEGVVFPDQESSLWEYDKKTKQYYLHQFYKHQPDLNVANPEVRDEIARIIGYWTQLGLSGFRVDAVPFLLETERVQDTVALPDPHDYLADLSAFLRRRNGEAVLLGEVNLPYPDTMAFFGARDGGGSTDELTMCFDFIGMQQMYLSLARADAEPLADALRQRPDPPEDGHWATFVRNHDELTLDKLTDAQRAEVFAAFGPDEDMQVYGRGLRRRLPPMLDGDARRIRMVYSLLFALPGTPVVFYGEEIGMGENLALDGRFAVRTPMQWSPEPGAGFSTADPSTFPGPVVEGAYGPEHVNVRDQVRDHDSLLSWFRLLVDSYRACPELAWGAYTVLDPGPDARAVLAHRCDSGEPGVGCTLIALHHFADADVEAAPVLPELAGVTLTDVLDPAAEPVVVGDDGRLTVPLGPYGCRWLRAS